MLQKSFFIPNTCKELMYGYQDTSSTGIPFKMRLSDLFEPKLTNFAVCSPTMNLLCIKMLVYCYYLIFSMFYKTKTMYHSSKEEEHQNFDM